MTAAASTGLARAAPPPRSRSVWRRRLQPTRCRFVTTPDTVTLAMLELAAVDRADHVDRPRLGRRPDRHHRGAPLRRARPRRRDRPRPGAQRAASGAAPPASTTGSSSASRTCSRTDLGAATVVTMYLLPRRQPAAAAAPARARAGHAHRLARLGPGRLDARPHRHRRGSRQGGSAATSSRASISGSSRRVHRPVVRRRSEPRHHAALPGASRRRSRSAKQRRSRDCLRRLHRDRDVARATASTRSRFASTARRLSLIGAGGTVPAQAFVRAGSGAADERRHAAGTARDRHAAVALPGARDRPPSQHTDEIAVRSGICSRALIQSLRRASPRLSVARPSASRVRGPCRKIASQERADDGQQATGDRCVGTTPSGDRREKGKAELGVFGDVAMRVQVDGFAPVARVDELLVGVAAIQRSLLWRSASG